AAVMTVCTPFCTALRALPHRVGTLPSRDDLLSKLPVVDEEGDGGWYLGTWQDLQQRTLCMFCQLVVLAISDSRPNGSTAVELEERISVVLFPDEQSFRLSYPSLLGTRIAFVANDEASALAPDHARAPAAASIDLERLKSWLAVCDEKHRSCGEGAVDTQETMVNYTQELAAPEKRAQMGEQAADFKESATSNFRVIDLESGCICGVALGVRYVTLSYVWGQSPMFSLQKSNLQQLSQKGSLEGIIEHLPSTVKDAIKLVNSIGERYLWVDGLCLVQDDPDDVTLGIGMMNSIYRGSYFTIVAGSGANAGSGLPGLRTSADNETRRALITKEVAPGLHLAIIHSIDWHLSHSIYNERGWTLQELVLPRRTIIFINDQVHFRCQEANWSEDTWSDKFTHWLDADDSNISRMPDITEGFLPSFWAYQKLCEEFSRRKLRDEGDALRALAGVTRPMAAAMDTIMVEGLPGYYLDHFLLFIATNGDLQRRDRFASFSWAGWGGDIMFPRENYLSYDQDSDERIEGVRDTSHIFNHLRHGRIVQWSYIDMDAAVEDLSFQWFDQSTLLDFMGRFPGVFDAAARDQDTFRKNWSSHQARYSSCSGSSGSIPMWDRKQDSDWPNSEWSSKTVEMEKSGSLDEFTVRAFDLAHSEAEFEKLVCRLGNVMQRVVLLNWMAVRSGRIRRAEESRTAVGPLPTWDVRETHLSSFRGPKRTHVSKKEDGVVWEDKRMEHCRQYLERRSKDDEAFDGPFEIPTFPPYTVLYFTTVSLHLRLDPTPITREARTRQNAFDRVRGISLLSENDMPVGSLHPDNFALLPASSSVIELLVVAYSQTPTTNSALFTFEHPDKHQSGPWKLLWCLYIVWKDGIAERRGVAQVQQTALETAVEPKPCVKSVLLG
ncbi:hypothetical protein J1614_012034, partial [Plenodomus biglobosus]